MARISIVLPVYNGERFLTDTLESIRQQTMKDFEVFCVDDASLDRSAAILEDFANRDERFHVLRRTVNLGTAGQCINYALPECTGDYFFYCSHDDLLSPDCLERVYERAVESNADAVLPDMAWYSAAGDNRTNIGPPRGDYAALLSGRQAFILSLDWTIHDFCLRKMDLVKRLGYHDLYANSDEYVSRLFFLNSSRVAFSRGIFYYRQDNSEAVTKRFSAKTFDWLGTDVRLLDLMEVNGIDPRHVRRYACGVAGSLRAKRRLFQEHGDELTPEQRVKAQQLMNAASTRLESLSVHDRMYVHLRETIRLEPIRVMVRWLRQAARSST
jgi:glycosyltransferase involved in cell wall biosynthesis